MNNETVNNTPSSQSKSSVIKPKKFISLSDILNSKTPPPLPPPSLPALTLVSTPTQDLAKEEDLTHQRGKLPTSNTISDLLTVQELFKELELDCDEQIKKLDEKERTLKEITLKQKEILDEIKQNWLARYNSSTRPLAGADISSGHRVSKLKHCNCFTRKEKFNNLKQKQHEKHSGKLNLNRKKNFLFIIFTSSSSASNSSQSTNESNSKYKQHEPLHQHQQIALFKLNTSNQIKKRFVSNQNSNKLVLVVNKFKSLVYTANFLFKIENTLDLEFFNLKTNFNTSSNSGKRSRNSRSNRLIKQEELNSNKLGKLQKTLLDKYYDKYCNSTTTVATANNHQLAHKKPTLLNLDTSSEYLSSFSSAPLSSSSTNSSMYSSNLKKVKFNINTFCNELNLHHLEFHLYI